MMLFQDVSKKSNDFLGELRVYLFSSGKNEKEIDEIVDELHDHLREAERKGKSVEDIIGRTPKDYMKNVAEEMQPDRKQWIKYMFLIVVGSFAIDIIGKLKEGNLAYSVLQLSGHIGIAVLFVLLVLIGYKHLTGASPKKQFFMLLPVAMMPIIAFVGLIFLDRAVQTPVIHFGTWGTWVVGGISVLFLIAASVWAKTWVLIIIIALLNLPDYLLSKTNLSLEYRSLASTAVLMIGLVLFMWLSNKADKQKE